MYDLEMAAHSIVSHQHMRARRDYISRVPPLSFYRHLVRLHSSPCVWLPLTFSPTFPGRKKDLGNGNFTKCLFT